MSELTIVAIETPSLGDRSYLVHDGRVAQATGADYYVNAGLPLVEGPA